jgi:hypothetical protein
MRSPASSARRAPVSSKEHDQASIAASLDVLAGAGGEQPLEGRIVNDGHRLLGDDRGLDPGQGLALISSSSSSHL